MHLLLCNCFLIKSFPWLHFGNVSFGALCTVNVRGDISGNCGQTFNAIICICVYQQNALTLFTLLLVRSHISGDSFPPRLWTLKLVQGTFRGTRILRSGLDLCICSGALEVPSVRPHLCQPVPLRHVLVKLERH